MLGFGLVAVSGRGVAAGAEHEAGVEERAGAGGSLQPEGALVQGRAGADGGGGALQGAATQKYLLPTAQKYLLILLIRCKSKGLSCSLQNTAKV